MAGWTLEDGVAEDGLDGVQADGAGLRQTGFGAHRQSLGGTVVRTIRTAHRDTGSDSGSDSVSDSGSGSAHPTLIPLSSLLCLKGNLKIVVKKFLVCILIYKKLHFHILMNHSLYVM